MHASAAGYVACKEARIQATMSACVGRNEGSIMARGVRKSITIPGLLAPTVKLRCAEFGHTIFTPYAVFPGSVVIKVGFAGSDFDLLPQMRDIHAKILSMFF